MDAGAAHYSDAGPPATLFAAGAYRAVAGANTWPNPHAAADNNPAACAYAFAATAGTHTTMDASAGGSFPANFSAGADYTRAGTYTFTRTYARPASTHYRAHNFAAGYAAGDYPTGRTYVAATLFAARPRGHNAMDTAASGSLLANLSACAHASACTHATACAHACADTHADRFALFALFPLFALHAADTHPAEPWRRWRTWRRWLAPRWRQPAAAGR